VWAVDRVKPKRPGPLQHERDLAARYPPYREARPPGPVVAVRPRRWTWWSAG
jgi:hypothetical protein